MYPNRNIKEPLNSFRFGINEVDNGFILTIESMTSKCRTYVFHTIDSLNKFLASEIEGAAK